MGDNKRLIDANALMDYIDKEHPYAGLPMASLVCTKELLTYAPTVDAVEVVHGVWIQSEPGYKICSHCSADVAIFSGHRNYCPNCGAKMDGERKDNESKRTD